MLLRVCIKVTVAGWLGIFIIFAFSLTWKKKINCEILDDINWGEKMCVKSVKWSEKWMTPTMTSKYLGDVNS